MFLLVISEIVGQFPNILTADDKKSLSNTEHLPQSLQMRLTKKQKLLSPFFFRC